MLIILMGNFAPRFESLMRIHLTFEVIYEEMRSNGNYR